MSSTIESVCWRLSGESATVGDSDPAIEGSKGHRLTKGQISGAKVGLILLSGVAINKLSEVVEISVPIIFVGTLVILLAMLFVESLGPQGAGDSALRQNLDLTKFCLASLMLGGAVGALWLIPLFSYQTIKYTLFWDAPIWFDTYELGAAVCLALLAAVAAFRKRKVLQVSAFIASSVTGMTMAISLKRDEHDFVNTFIGWTATAATAAAVAYLAPDIVRLFRQFWGKG